MLQSAPLVASFAEPCPRSSPYSEMAHPVKVHQTVRDRCKPSQFQRYHAPAVSLLLRQMHKFLA